ncbi:MAG: hypothetical protein AAF485_22945, partial [Chloroflexota bacterium]
MALTIPNYTLGQKIYETNLTSIYRATHTADGKSVIVKTLQDSYPRPQDINRLKREYEILRKLQGLTGIINLFELVEFGDDNLAIIMEPFGQSLAALLQTEGPLKLSQFLTIAC